MKNIYDILKDFGLEVPEDKKADFDKVWKENYRTKSDYDKVAGQRDSYKTSLDTVNTKLKEFEGVDVADLKQQITTLQGDLKKKDDEYAAKEADRLFNETLDKAISAAGGRNAKAIRGLLDLETLKGSKDQTEDINKALEAVKKSDAYLFGVDEPFLNPVGPTNDKGGEEKNMGSLASIRAAMGLPPKKGE
ncbi:MAG TPA: phage scaffolding protein [Candidatus Fusicatenibacter intestinigallinarum]|uniref:Phage scaffolding protein n=1 Tax=Candidatus Fusicatenibacter intestinigallinarum TaxID=2838598 RepID=A0A9D2NDK5_9FIRM|nr:phage scaffolding protein [Candidatus Fusicatenibacter intestinigallinarum]